MATYPYLELTFSIGTWEADGEAYPDTGFEGGLAIPLGVAREVLADYQVSKLRLADGTIQDAPTWAGLVTLEDRTFRTEIVAIGNHFLLGREVLDQLEICFSFGREVRLAFKDQATAA